MFRGFNTARCISQLHPFDQSNRNTKLSGFPELSEMQTKKKLHWVRPLSHGFVRLEHQVNTLVHIRLVGFLSTHDTPNAPNPSFLCIDQTPLDFSTFEVLGPIFHQLFDL
jgi:hypothetical protein